MRLKLTFKQKKANQIIPINYQYALSSFMYHTIERSDSVYSRWLHDVGFKSGSKSFKMFTFSKLDIPELEITGDRIQIGSDRINLIVSMLSDKAIEHLIIGMFEKQQMRIFDSKSEAEFDIEFVELVPEPEFNEEMFFKTISPIVISKKIKYNGKDSEYYVRPDDADYSEYFMKNLEEKYLALLSANVNLSFLGSDTPDLHSSAGEIELVGNHKSKMITIRQGTAEQTEVRAFFTKFKIKAPKALIKLGYEAGFGKLCSMGFGCADLLKKSDLKNTRNRN